MPKPKRRLKNCSKKQGWSRFSPSLMHTPDSTTKTLEMLWGNYLALASQVDPATMVPDLLDEYRQRRMPTQPMRLATWLARQSFSLAAWSLWEQYSAFVCVNGHSERPKFKQSNHVLWVRDTMLSQGRTFRDWQWFNDARCIRNLVAHYAGRVSDIKSHALLETGRIAFPEIDTYADGYLRLTHDHVAELQVKIEEFVEDSKL